MKIKFIYDNSIGRTIEVQSNVSEDDIKALFPVVLNREYDEKCTYKIIDLNVADEDEMLAYTE